MAKPHKSTFEALVDAFCEFPIAEQNRALELMSFEHRRARIRAAKQTARTEDLAAQTTATEALRKTNGQPDVERSRTGQLISDKVAIGAAPVVSLIDAMQEDT